MINIDEFMQFVIIFVISLLGSLGNDYYNTITEKDENINMARIVLGAITGAFIMLGISEKLDVKDGKFFILLCFIAGIGGFKAFKGLKSIDLHELFLKFVPVKEKDDESENK